FAACSLATLEERCERFAGLSRDVLLLERREGRGGIARRRDGLVAQQPPVAKGQDAAPVARDLRLMRDEYDGHAFTVQPLQERHDLDAGPGVKVAGRLVRPWACRGSREYA